MTSFKNALFADLIASVVGTAAWMTGTANVVWPAHPVLAVLAITLVADILLRYVWPLKVAKA
jgi:hypothetical protein